MSNGTVTAQRLVAAPLRRATAQRTLGDRTQQLADVLAVFVFGLGGGLVAVHAGHGLFAALAAAFLSGLGGGIVRDVVLGGTPPVTLRSPTLPVTTVLAGAAAFVLHAQLDAIPVWAFAGLDAAGLGLLCSAGALRSLHLGAHQILAVVFGAVSAVGGGIIRDLLLGQEPYALTCGMYGISAAFGAAATVTGRKLGLTRSRALALGVATGFALRVISVGLGWDLRI